MNRRLRLIIHLTLAALFVVMLAPFQSAAVHADEGLVEYDFSKIGLEYRGVIQPDDHAHHLRLIGDPAVVPSVYGTNFSSQIESRTPGLERSFSFDVPEAGLYTFEFTGVLGSGGGYGDIYLKMEDQENEILLFSQFDFYKYAHLSAYQTVTSPETIALTSGTHTIIFRAVGLSESSTNYMYANVLKLKAAELSSALFAKEAPEDVTISLPFDSNQITEIVHDQDVLTSGSDYDVEGMSITIKKEYLNLFDSGTIRLSIRISGGVEIPLDVEIMEYQKEFIVLDFSELSLEEPGDWYLTGLNPTAYPRVTFPSIGGVQIAISHLVPRRSVTFKVESAGFYEIDFTGNLISNSGSTAYTDIYLDTDQDSTKLFDQFYFVGEGQRTERAMVTPVYLHEGLHQFTFVHADPEHMSNNNIFPDSFTLTKLGNSAQPISETFDIIRPTDLNFELDLASDVVLTEVKNGTESLRRGEDYDVSGNLLTIKQAYLSTLLLGETKIDLIFNKRNNFAVTIEVIDSTPILESGPFHYDKKVSDQADVLVGLEANGHQVKHIRHGEEILEQGIDYVITTDAIVLKRRYLATLDEGSIELTVVFSEDIQPTVLLEISDTSTTIDPDYVRLLKNDIADREVVVTYFPYGETNTELVDIYKGNERLSSGEDYTRSGTSITLRSPFISTLEQGITTLHFVMSDGSEPSLQIHVTENPLSADITSLIAKTSENQVIVEGNIDSGANKQVSIMVTNPDGVIEYIGQTTSGDHGDFHFSYTKNSHLPGVYTVSVGGEWVDRPQETTFHYTWEPHIMIADIIHLLEHYRDEIQSEEAFRALSIHLVAVGQFEKQEDANKIAQHMESWVMLLEHWRNRNELTEPAYDALLSEAHSFLEQLQ